MAAPVASAPRLSRTRRNPTAADLTALLELAGQLGEIADPGERLNHAIMSFVELVGGRASVFAHMDCDPINGRPLRLADGACFGLDGNEFLFLGCDFFSGGIPCPLAGAYRYGRHEVTSTRLVAPPRARLIDDAAWQRSAYRNDILRPYGIDAVIVARYTNSTRGQDVGLSIMREPRDRPAGGREQKLIELFLDRLGPLFIPPRVARDPELEALSPRLRKVLDGLLIGDSPKQIARVHGLTLATTYEYTKRLYRHFNVSGRGELLARFVEHEPRRNHVP